MQPESILTIAMAKQWQYKQTVIFVVWLLYMIKKEDVTYFKGSVFDFTIFSFLLFFLKLSLSMVPHCFAT